MPSFESGRYGLAVYVSTTCLKNSREVSHFLLFNAAVPLSKRNLSGSAVPGGTRPRGFDEQADAIAATAISARGDQRSIERVLLTVCLIASGTRPPILPRCRRVERRRDRRAPSTCPRTCAACRPSGPAAR